MTRPILLCSANNGLARDLQRTVAALEAGGRPPETRIARNADDGLRMARELKEPLVIVDARLDNATDLLRSLQQETPEATRTAVSSAWPDTLRYAVQAAGAAHTLDAPLEAAELSRLLGLGSLLTASGRQGRLVCFIAAQSGNGASTICLHVGRLLAGRSKRGALLVELDFHSGALACRMGLQPERTLADLSGLDSAEASRRWREAVAPWKGLDVLLGPGSSNAMVARGLPPVNAVLDDALRVYGDVLVDLPCSVNASVREVLARAGHVYLTATPEVSSLHLAARRVQELLAAGVAESRISLVLNRVAPAGALDEEDVRRIVGVGVKHKLRNDYYAAAHAEAQAEALSPESALGRGLEEIADELVGKKPSASQRVQQKLDWFFRGLSRG
jgi:Flp pilus assembly CpaE family ATPase